MKKITAELLPIKALPKEHALSFAQWVWNGIQKNLFEPAVLGYPRTVMARASNGEEPLLFVPVQAALLYDAIAAKPGLTAREEALSLWRIGEVVDKAAAQEGFSEIYFFCADDSVADICAKHGFQEIKGVRVLKRQVPKETP